MSSCLAELRERRGVGEQRTVNDVGEAALDGAQRLGGGVSSGGVPLDAVGQGAQPFDSALPAPIDPGQRLAR